MTVGKGGGRDGPRPRGETSRLVQVLCLAFAALVLTTDVGYCLTGTVFASRAGDFGAPVV